MIPFFFTSLMSYEEGREVYRWVAFGLFTAAAATDIVDGWLARTLRQKSELGTFLDPVADKLLIVSGFLALAIVDSIRYPPPLWVVVAVIFREIFIAGGFLMYFMLFGKIRVLPNIVGKATVMTQMVTIALVLTNWKISLIFCYITAGLSVLSCLVYLVRDLKLLQGDVEWP